MLLMASKDNMAAKRFSSALTKLKIVIDSLEIIPQKVKLRFNKCLQITANIYIIYVYTYVYFL